MVEFEVSKGTTIYELKKRPACHARCPAEQLTLVFGGSQLDERLGCGHDSSGHESTARQPLVSTTPGFVKGKLYFPRVFHFFDTKSAFCPDHPSFPHMTFQSLGYVMKRATAFRACPPSVLGWVRVFVRAVGTENSEKTKKSGGSGEKVIFVGEM